MARVPAQPDTIARPVAPRDEAASPHVPRLGLRERLLAPAVVEPAAVWALSRFLMLLLTYLGVILFNSALHDPSHPSFLHQLLPAWANTRNHGWDTEWYTDIARRGYDWKKAAGTSPAAFFPLYPLLIRVGVAITHRSYLGVALVISNLCFLFALSYLWRLTRWELGTRAAGRAILYISLFPTALFFFAGYTESLFLLLTVACFYHLRREDWLVAGTFGALASATRVTGVLLAVPFAYEYARASNFSWRRAIGPGLLGLALVPVGLLTFMLYLQRTVGDALAFNHDQAAWQKIFTLRLWAGTLESVRQVLVVQPWASFFEVHNVINLTALILALGTTVLAVRMLPAPYALYLAAFWVVTLSSPAMAGGYPVPLISMSRYILSLFPVFMVWAVLGANRRFHDGYLMLAPAILAVFTVQFLNGGWII